MAQFSLIPFNSIPDYFTGINFTAKANWSDDSLYLGYTLDGPLDFIDFGEYQANKSRVMNL